MIFQVYDNRLVVIPITDEESRYVKHLIELRRKKGDQDNEFREKFKQFILEKKPGETWDGKIQMWKIKLKAWFAAQFYNEASVYGEPISDVTGGELEGFSLEDVNRVIDKFDPETIGGDL